MGDLDESGGIAVV